MRFSSGGKRSAGSKMDGWEGSFIRVLREEYVKWTAVCSQGLCEWVRGGPALGTGH